MDIKPYIPVALCCIVVAAPAAWADSPLTSTNFAAAYQDVDIVRYASERGLNNRVFEALSNPDIPHDVRAAIINQIGWSNEPQQNGKRYIEYIARDRSTTPSQLTIEMLTPQEALALGYLSAMDNRFSPTQPIGGSGEVQQADAFLLMDVAMNKAPNDFSVSLIRSLVQAQNAFRLGEGNWCSVYEAVNTVVTNFPGKRNMRPQAVEIVMDYIESYRDWCSPRRSVQSSGSGKTGESTSPASK